MANHTSAKKCIRKSARRTAINKNRVSRIRTFLRKFEDAVATGVKETALTAIREVEKEIMRGVRKGVIHQNAASRKVSRLTKRIKALSA
jgi:small subunit ribosomal protein S20